MSWRNGSPTIWRLLASSITAIGLMLIPLMPTLAHAASAHGHKSDNAGHFKVAKPDGALTASWWQKFVAIAGPDSFDRCDVGTRKIVFWLEQPAGPIPGPAPPTRPKLSWCR